MKKLLIIGLIMITIAFTGCDNAKEEIANKLEEQQKYINENTQENIEDFITTQNNINNYKIQGDVKFEPISYQRIDDGSTYGVFMVVYKDMQTNKEYLYVQSKSGISFTPIN